MREFMAKIFGGSAANDLARLPAVSVTMFGKHPAWGDHIDSLGDESPVLNFVRDLLYGEGLNRQIETGAWEKLSEERRLPGFDHFFVWCLGGRMVMGLLWSSSDSHGRTQYPLVLVAETHRRHESEFVRKVQEALVQAKRRCVEATEQAGVTRAVAELRASLQRFSPRQPAESIGLRIAPNFQTATDDLPRVLHEMRGSCGHLSSSRWSAATSPDGASMIRVKLSGADSSSLLDWIGLVSSQLHPAVPLLGFAERTEGIADILMGTPTAQNFFCLRASPKMLPYTTDIPFEIPTGLRDYAGALAAGMKKGERPSRTVFGDVVASHSSWKAPLSLLKN
jgi:hypothetical protein